LQYQLAAAPRAELPPHWVGNDCRGRVFGLKARDITAWGEAPRAEPQVVVRLSHL